MKNTFLFLFLLASLLYSCQEARDKEQTIKIVTNEKTVILDTLYSELYKADAFNGNVLVAEEGNIIYQKSFGVANRETNEELNLETTFELASVSKQFTAMGIVQLQKEGKLSYEDSLSKYIPELSSYEGITIKNLLTHTSGLPDYMRFADRNIFLLKKTRNL